MDQYLSTYQNDYLWPAYTCPMGSHRMRADPGVEQGKVECKAVTYPGSASPSFQTKSSSFSCPCQPGGNMPIRGAVAMGQPTNLDKKCGCATEPTCPQITREDMAEMMYKAAETGAFKNGEKCSSCSNKPDLNPLKGKYPAKQLDQYSQLPKQEKLRPKAPGQFGGQFEGPLNIPEPDQSQPYTFNTPCKCSPNLQKGGPQNYGTTWIRDKARDEPVGEMLDPGSVSKPEPPAARVSCAPESDVSRYDQPNTFMKKLYDKYPYLYQILRDTPPEELIARVFKDRFLSTYQVDYLHMGSGKEHYPAGGSPMNERYAGPDEKDETNKIPGCSFRYNKKGNFGEKKTDLESKKRRRDDDDIEKNEPNVSEYMRTISKLGDDIISDQLYKIEAATKRMMKTYVNF